MSYHGVRVAHYVQFWNPDPLLPLDILNNEMLLSMERPTLNSHYLIVPRFKNSDDWKATETIMERGMMQSTYETI